MTGMYSTIQTHYFRNKYRKINGTDLSCMAREMATAANGTHPAGMHSCYSLNWPPVHVLAIVKTFFFEIIGGSNETLGTFPPSRSNFFNFHAGFSKTFVKTRMHSSGTRTARLLTVYLPRGWLPARGCTGPEGTCPGTPPGGQTDTCKNITFANLITFANPVVCAASS